YLPMMESDSVAVNLPVETASSDLPDRLPFPPITYSHILHCSYHDWHPRYRTLAPKSRVIPLTPQFVTYLRSDGIVLPPEPIRPRDDDDLDTFSDSGDEAEDPSTEWADIHTQIKDTIAEFGKVTPKLNWSAPKDATFMSATNDTKCATPNDVYLLLKSSDFITHDLEHPFDDCVPDNTDSTNGDAPGAPVVDSPIPDVPYHLVLRKYANFNPSLEFRCFVRNRKLLCMCQRDLNYFDFLFDMRDLFRSRIQAFFDEKLRDTFPDPNFTFDVYVPAPHQRVWLVDINPWAQRTDSLLFSWLEILRMKDPIGFEEEGDDDLDGGFVRISLHDGSIMTSDEVASGVVEEVEGDSEDEDETVEEGDDELAPFLPEVRLVKKNDPEAYQFSTPQYSAHKVPKDLVDASLAGPGGMSEFMGKWQEILARQTMQQQQDESSDSE
ncbi:hypothetical protein N7466_003253, partial [Penicillium verhagenii]|uniref:uncharacterized protein n=1 Tax=Penicillium verhagenii TaxID=1562060 RepID=UPI0025459641